MRATLSLVLLALLAVPVQATNDGRWDNSPWRDWFGRQHNADGGFCCDGYDAYIYDGAWTINPDGSVTIPMDGGGSLTIEPGRVLPFNPNDPNPTGQAVWWRSDDGATYCFALGTLM